MQQLKHVALRASCDQEDLLRQVARLTWCVKALRELKKGTTEKTKIVSESYHINALNG